MLTRITKTLCNYSQIHQVLGTDKLNSLYTYVTLEKCRKTTTKISNYKLTSLCRGMVYAGENYYVAERVWFSLSPLWKHGCHQHLVFTPVKCTPSNTAQVLSSLDSTIIMLTAAGMEDYSTQTIQLRHYLTQNIQPLSKTSIPIHSWFLGVS